MKVGLLRFGRVHRERVRERAMRADAIDTPAMRLHVHKALLRVWDATPSAKAAPQP